jgi:cyanophycinase
MNRPLLLVSILLMLACWPTEYKAYGQTFSERFDDWPERLKINGRLAIAAESQDVRLLKELLADPLDTATCLLITDDSPTPHIAKAYEQLFASVKSKPLDQLHELKPESIPPFIAWHVNEWPLLPDALAAHKREQLLVWFTNQLEAGKTIVVTGDVAQAVGKWFSLGNELLSTQSGLDLFPDCVLQLEFSAEQVKPTIGRVKSQRRCVAIGLEPHTLLLLDGRKLQVAGEGRAWLMLPRTSELPSRVETLATRQGAGQPTNQWLADLTEWRRDAIDRTLEPFPPIEPQVPQVEQGTLVIVGGGGMPDGLMQRFIDLAGGTESAKLVYIPCEERERVPLRASIIDEWHELGVAHTALLHTKDRQQAHSDEAFLAPLADATGIWFGGGRQWNFADSYYGTQAHRLMKQVVQRGGVIGGSSAGASIQAQYLARATPIENFRIMAPGYERGGLGFLCGVAIDQHFSQRRRQADMSALVNRYPQLLGIGIDEGTAIVVRGSQAEVVGDGAVYFYDRRQAAAPDGADYRQLTAGDYYDMATRQQIEGQIR